MNQPEHLEEPQEEEGEIQGYRVIYERTGNGWSAYAPDLPGLGGGAPTREEMEQLMREAIPIHLEELVRDRQERPWLYKPEDLSPELRAVFARIDAAWRLPVVSSLPMRGLTAITRQDTDGMIAGEEGAVHGLRPVARVTRWLLCYLTFPGSR